MLRYSSMIHSCIAQLKSHALMVSAAVVQPVCGGGVVEAPALPRSPCLFPAWLCQGLEPRACPVWISQALPSCGLSQNPWASPEPPAAAGMRHDIRHCRKDHVATFEHDVDLYINHSTSSPQLTTMCPQFLQVRFLAKRLKGLAGRAEDATPASVEEVGGQPPAEPSLIPLPLLRELPPGQA
jgi:hypothetical protein